MLQIQNLTLRSKIKFYGKAANLFNLQLKFCITTIMSAICLAFIAFPDGLSAITMGYNSDDAALKPGMVVSLSQTSDSVNPKVERASDGQEDRVIGVTTTVNESLITIASGNQTVYVETGGEVDAYVSNLNGEVARGELLSLSPLKGILTKASPTSAAIAIALEDFSGESAESHAVVDGSGSRDVLIQKVRVNLDHQAVVSSAALNISSLSRIGKSIAGKEVGEVRVVIALIIFFIVLIAEGSIIYGAISSAITSLGRNPLAKKIIKRELVRVLGIALLVLAMGVATIYAVLWI